MLTTSGPPIPYDFLPKVGSLTVVSDQVTTGEVIPVSCQNNAVDIGGENLSPHLEWTGQPAGTKSFAITCYDPDAPTGSGFWHWLVINIPAGVTSVPLGAGVDDSSLPGNAVHRRNDLGSYAYDGAAPPPGATPHRYIFAVHALDVENLDVPPEASASVVGFNLTGHTLARGLVVPVFGR